MQWLNKVVDDIVARFPEGDILVESGGSPSGTYHIGHMRELITCDAIMLELRRRGRPAKHIYYVDDLDAFRKVPANVPPEWDKYLGYPLCDTPAPDGSERSYADYFLHGLIDSCRDLNVEVEFIRSHENYRRGFMVPAIERCLERIPQSRQALETISNRKLDENWTPIQVMDQSRLKNRKFVGMDKTSKTLQYEDSAGEVRTVKYDAGEVKLDWRLDWPGRWWLLGVHVEPFGREHASAGGSYDTGVQIMKDVYEAAPPIPVPYESIHMVGDTKKMSASKGTALSASEGLQIMPAEVLRFFVLGAPLKKKLEFDAVNGVVKLMDEFAALAAKADRTEDEEQLLYICTRGIDKKTVSRVPFSHLVASYQASLKDADKTLAVIRRTEYAQVVDEDAAIIREELRFIDEWLQRWAPEEVKFEPRADVNASEFSEQERAFLQKLGDLVAKAPEGAEGAWFHDAIYGLKDEAGLQPKDMFGALYRLLIGKTSGPRAGYFLSILPRDWLVARLRLEA